MTNTKGKCERYRIWTAQVLSHFIPEHWITDEVITLFEDNFEPYYFAHGLSVEAMVEVLRIRILEEKGDWKHD